MDTSVRVAARSRRGKLDSLVPEQLVLVVRESLFCANVASRHHTVAPELRLLRHAAGRGCEEAAWLLGLLTSEGGVPHFGRDRAARARWLARRVGEDSARGAYYGGLAVGSSDPAAGVELLRQAALRGCVPAMSALGAALLELKAEAEGRAWLRRAADASDPDGLALAARYVERSPDVALGLYQRAAALGSLHGVFEYARWAKDKTERAMLWGRWVLLSGGSYWDAREVEEVLWRLSEGHAVDRHDVQLVFVSGRELEGYEQFWDDDGRRITSGQATCVDVYLMVTYRARRAALQVLAGLRQRGFPREIAGLIGRCVYDTRREDAFAWFDGLPGDVRSALTKRQRRLSVD